MEPTITILEDRVITSDDFDSTLHTCWAITFREPQDIRDILYVLAIAGLSPMKFCPIEQPKPGEENEHRTSTPA